MTSTMRAAPCVASVIMPAWLPVNERASWPMLLIAIASSAIEMRSPARSMSSSRGAGIGVTSCGEVEQLVGGVAHRGDGDDDVVARLAGLDDALRDPLDALRVGDGRTRRTSARSRLTWCAPKDATPAMGETLRTRSRAPERPSYVACGDIFRPGHVRRWCSRSSPARSVIRAGSFAYGVEVLVAAQSVAFSGRRVTTTSNRIDRVGAVARPSGSPVAS